MTVLGDSDSIYIDIDQAEQEIITDEIARAAEHPAGIREGIEIELLHAHPTEAKEENWMPFEEARYLLKVIRADTTEGPVKAGLVEKLSKQIASSEEKANRWRQPA